jgi:HAD superfamily hydrolase (TIGR01509 family)
VIEREWGRRLPAEYDAQAKATLAGLYATDLRPIAHVSGTLAAIDLPVCVASSSMPDKLHQGLMLTGLHARFAPHIFSASQVRRGKPAPDLFLFAAERMGGTAPAGCLVVEDSVAGVVAAVAAGMRVLGFVGGSHCGPDHADALRRVGAAATFDDMRRLPSLLASCAGGSAVAGRP